MASLMFDPFSEMSLLINSALPDLKFRKADIEGRYNTLLHSADTPPLVLLGPDGKEYPANGQDNGSGESRGEWSGP
jgi:hypothetical protein